MTPSRAYATALLGLLLGAALVVWSYAQAWGTAQVLMPGSEATAALSVTGQSLWPLGQVAGWLAAASALGIIATRGWGRTVVAVVAVAAGLAAIVGAMRFAVGAAALLNAHVADSQGATGSGPTSATLWWLVAIGGGVLVVISGGWTAARGGQWPVMGTRYERGPRRLSAWEAMDMGQDPTDDLVE